MRIFLAKSQKVPLPVESADYASQPQQRIVIRRSNGFTVTPELGNDEFLMKSFYRLLNGNRDQVAELWAYIQLGVGFFTDDTGGKRAVFSITDERGYDTREVFEKLGIATRPGDLKFAVEVDRVTLETRTHVLDSFTVTTDLLVGDMAYIYRPDSYVVEITNVNVKTEMPISTWNTHTCKYWNIYVTLYVDFPEGYLFMDRSNRDIFAPYKKMLDEGKYADVVLLTDEGKHFKCHIVFLANCSNVFEMTFNKTAPTDGKRVIPVRDMNDVSVEALLRYIYHSDLYLPEMYYSVCFELLVAADCYNITALKDSMESIITGNGPMWMDLDSTIRLYIFCCQKKFEKLKMDAVTKIKRRYSEFSKFEYGDRYALYKKELFELELMLRDKEEDERW